jgi:ketosteroid isomerase-like protein
MTTSPDVVAADINTLADRFFGAVSGGDLETVRACYAPHARIWHNFDNTEQTRDENVQLLSWVTSNWKNFRFENVRRRLTDDGFIQQHVMRGEGPDGTPFESPSILILTVNDSQITRIEEYFDAGQVPLPQG